MDAAVMRGLVDELADMLPEAVWVEAPVWLSKLAGASVPIGLLLVAAVVCGIAYRLRRPPHWTELPPPRYPGMGTDEQRKAADERLVDDGRRQRPLPWQQPWDQS